MKVKEFLELLELIKDIEDYEIAKYLKKQLIEYLTSKKV
jgi:hypothetical protein